MRWRTYVYTSTRSIPTVLVSWNFLHSVLQFVYLSEQCASFPPEGNEIFLPPANEVWGRVICLQACVCPQGGCLLPGGVCSGGVCSQEGCLFWGGRGVSAPGGMGVSAPGGLLRGDVRGGTWWRPPTTATAAGATHSTGMHSCFKIN